MDWLSKLQRGITPTSESRDLPAAIQRAGDAGERAWDDFFSAVIANDLTRIAYNRAVRRFLEWPNVSGRKLHEITAADVGDYLRGLSGSLPKKKQHHSALRRFFNLMVERHLCASSIRRWLLERNGLKSQKAKRHKSPKPFQKDYLSQLT